MGVTSFSLSEYAIADVGWGFASEPNGQSFQPSPDPLAGFKKEGLGGGGREEWRGRTEEKMLREGSGRKWEGTAEGGIQPLLLGRIDAPGLNSEIPEI